MFHFHLNRYFWKPKHACTIVYTVVSAHMHQGCLMSQMQTCVWIKAFASSSKNHPSNEKIQICEAILRIQATTNAFQEGSIVTNKKTSPWDQRYVWPRRYGSLKDDFWQNHRVLRTLNPKWFIEPYAKILYKQGLFSSPFIIFTINWRITGHMFWSHLDHIYRNG